MLNYEITRSPAQRGHQRRVITTEIVARISIVTVTSRELDLTAVNKIDLSNARKVKRQAENSEMILSEKPFRKFIRNALCYLILGTLRRITGAFDLITNLSLRELKVWIHFVTIDASHTPLY